MHTYSASLQAIVSRTLAESNVAASNSTSFHLTPTDFSHVQEVISSTLTTLKIAIRLSDEDVLRFCPVKTFLNITTASIFLLKGLVLGVSAINLEEAMNILRQVIIALKGSNPDDLHIGGRYATLLEMRVTKLQKHFVPSLRPHDITPPDNDRSLLMGASSGEIGAQFDFMDMDVTEGGTLNSNWLTLPLDTSSVNFGMENFQGLQCLGDDTLDFLWSLGA